MAGAAHVQVVFHCAGPGEPDLTLTAVGFHGVDIGRQQVLCEPDPFLILPVGISVSRG